MPYWMPEFLQGIIGKLLTSVIISIGLMAWGKFQKRSKWSNPTAAFYGIVTSAVLLYLFNQLGWEPSNKVKIRQWMDDVKFGTKNVSDKEHDFIFEIQDQRKTIFYIYQPKDQFRAFVVTELGYDAESAFPQLKAMDKKSLESLIRQLHIDMAQKGVTVDKLLRPLNKVKLQCIIPASSLTQDRILSCVQLLDTSFHLLQERIASVVIPNP